MNRFVINALVFALMLAILLPAARGLRKRPWHFSDRVFLLSVAACMFILFFGTLRLMWTRDPRWRRVQRETDQFRNVLISRSRMGRILSIDGQPLAETSADSTGQFRRYYPLGAAAPFAGYPFGNSPFSESPAEGLEQAYMWELSGIAASGEDWRGTKVVPVGRDVQLTIDSRLQQSAYTLLDSHKGAAVIVDVRTGAIMALASSPSFDPNLLTRDLRAYERATRSAPLRNYALTAFLPLGNGLCLLNAAAVARADRNGSGDSAFGIRLQQLRTQQAIGAISAPVWGWRLSKQLSLTSDYLSDWFNYVAPYLSRHLAETAQALGFNDSLAFNGDRTLPLSISVSYFPNPDHRTEKIRNAPEPDPAVATPLQLCLIAAAIANDGIMMQPRLVVADSIPNRVWKSAMATALAAEVKDGVPRSVTRAGERRDSSGFVSDAVSVSYGLVSGESSWLPSPDSYTHAWSIAFAPYESPVLAFAICIERGGKGEVAAASAVRSLIALAAECGYFNDDRNALR